MMEWPKRGGQGTGVARVKVSFSILPSSVSLRTGCERVCPALGPAAWPAGFGFSAVTG